MHTLLSYVPDGHLVLDCESEMASQHSTVPKLGGWAVRLWVQLSKKYEWYCKLTAYLVKHCADVNTPRPCLL